MKQTVTSWHQAQIQYGLKEENCIECQLFFTACGHIFIGKKMSQLGISTSIPDDILVSIITSQKNKTKNNKE